MCAARSRNPLALSGAWGRSCKCGFCGKPFDTPRGRIRHEQIVHGAATVRESEHEESRVGTGSEIGPTGTVGSALPPDVRDEEPEALPVVDSGDPAASVWHVRQWLNDGSRVGFLVRSDSRERARLIANRYVDVAFS